MHNEEAERIRCICDDVTNANCYDTAKSVDERKKAIECELVVSRNDCDDQLS